MTGCLECPFARPVLAQSWSQTATDGTWYSSTALLSGRDRPLRLCVLGRVVPSPKLGVQECGGLFPEHQPPRGARWQAEFDRYP